MFVPIKGYEGIYSIDEYGNVFNERIKDISKYYITNKGYKAIDLNKDGKKEKCLVHRLVALHFVPNPNNYPIVLHKDNVKTNTYYKNLECGTYSQNNSQAIRDGINTIPRPDNRVYYEVRNSNDEIEAIGFGIDNLKETVQYQYSNRGLYSLIFRGNSLQSGPYEGCNIVRSELTPAIYFIG